MLRTETQQRPIDISGLEEMGEAGLKVKSFGQHEVLQDPGRVPILGLHEFAEGVRRQRSRETQGAKDCMRASHFDNMRQPQTLPCSTPNENIFQKAL